LFVFFFNVLQHEKISNKVLHLFKFRLIYRYNYKIDDPCYAFRTYKNLGICIRIQVSVLVILQCTLTVCKFLNQTYQLIMPRTGTIIHILTLACIVRAGAKASHAETRREDDLTLQSLNALVQQQAAVIQQQSAVIQQQSASLQALQADMTSVKARLATAEGKLQQKGRQAN
jgi:hypothetical protein